MNCRHKYLFLLFLINILILPAYGSTLGQQATLAGRATHAISGKLKMQNATPLPAGTRDKGEMKWRLRVGKSFLTPASNSRRAIQGSDFNLFVGEGDGHVTVKVLRSSNTSSTETLDYDTSDSSGLNPCSSVTSIASSRCDYATTMGTLRYAPGETSKTVTIPLVDDSYAEGNETFSLTFSNPNGFKIGPIFSFAITITDNESVNGANPLASNNFFVRQHYIDFLGREPDSFGFKGWLDILGNCKAGDTSCDRIEVSSGFFRSPEFQERGYFTYRFYSVALGRKPNYAEFIPDLARVSGFLTEAEKEANKVAFVDEFMQRTEFKMRYDSKTTPTAYVDALLATAGLLNHPSRAGWIDGLNKGTLTRARVLRELAESAESNSKFYTQAFVVMQYFGYLRRDPDSLYLKWIDTMNQNPANYRSMVDGFVNSAEYRQRFGN